MDQYPSREGLWVSFRCDCYGPDSPRGRTRPRGDGADTQTKTQPPLVTPNRTLAVVHGRVERLFAPLGTE